MQIQSQYKFCKSQKIGLKDLALSFYVVYVLLLSKKVH